jgi:hypothetical protein
MPHELSSRKTTEGSNLLNKVSRIRTPLDKTPKSLLFTTFSDAFFLLSSSLSSDCSRRIKFGKPNITDKNGRAAVQLMAPPNDQKCQGSGHLVELVLRKSAAQRRCFGNILLPIRLHALNPTGSQSRSSRLSMRATAGSFECDKNVIVPGSFPVESLQNASTLGRCN